MTALMTLKSAQKLFGCIKIFRIFEYILLLLYVGQEGDEKMREKQINRQIGLGRKNKQDVEERIKEREGDIKKREGKGRRKRK